MAESETPLLPAKGKTSGKVLLESRPAPADRISRPKQIKHGRSLEDHLLVESGKTPKNDSQTADELNKKGFIDGEFTESDDTQTGETPGINIPEAIVIGEVAAEAGETIYEEITGIRNKKNDPEPEPEPKKPKEKEKKKEKEVPNSFVEVQNELKKLIIKKAGTEWEDKLVEKQEELVAEAVKLKVFGGLKGRAQTAFDDNDYIKAMELVSDMAIHDQTHREIDGSVVDDETKKDHHAMIKEYCEVAHLVAQYSLKVASGQEDPRLLREISLRGWGTIPFAEQEAKAREYLQKIQKQGSEDKYARPDWKNAPPMSHDNSFFDEKFLRDWGIPVTFYKLEGYSWAAADMVHALNTYAELGTIVDTSIKDAFDKAISTLDNKKLKLFYGGIMQLLILRKQQNGTVDIYAGKDDAGTGSIIEKLDVQAVAGALNASEDTRKALAACLALTGLEVKDANMGIVDEIKKSYSSLEFEALVDEKTEKTKLDLFKPLNTLNTKTASDETEERNLKDIYQPQIDAHLAKMKKEMASKLGVSLGAVECAMTFTLMWGGDMANWRWAQMENRYPIFAKEYMGNFMTSLTAVDDGIEKHLADILKDSGTQRLLTVLEDFPSQKLLEKWSYLGVVRSTTLEMMRLTMLGEAYGSKTKELIDRENIIYDEILAKQPLGKWGFDKKILLSQMRSLKFIKGFSELKEETKIGIAQLPGYIWKRLTS